MLCCEINAYSNEKENRTAGQTCAFVCVLSMRILSANSICILLEDFQLLKQFPAVYRTRISLSHSQAHNTCSCLDADKLIPHPLHIPWRTISLLFSHLRLVLTCIFFPSYFLNKSCTHLSPIMLHAPPISFPLCTQFETLLTHTLLSIPLIKF
jgi:hypothetical protein